MVTNFNPCDGMDATFDKIEQSTRLVAALPHLPRFQLVISIPATTALAAITQATPLPEIDPDWHQSVQDQSLSNYRLETSALQFVLTALFVLLIKVMEVNNDCNNQRLRGKTMDFDQELDARGINCPLPIIRAKKSIESMDNGQLLRIVATDPGSVKDFQAFCEQTKNELVEHKEEGGEYLFLIRKTA